MVINKTGLIHILGETVSLQFSENSPDRICMSYEVAYADILFHNLVDLMT